MLYTPKNAIFSEYRGAAIAILAAAAALGLLLAWLPVDHTIGRFIYDDMFYYLRVAEFIAQGQGSTFDGISSTNGYHPVWMLICSILALFFSGDMLVHAALTIAAALHVAQGYMLLRIFGHFVHPLVGLGITALYLLNWRSLAINLCGLETALATLMILIVFYRLMLRPVTGRYRDAVVTGLLLGFAVLCRFDLLLLVGFVGLCTLFDRRYPGGVTPLRRIGLGLATGAASLAMLSIWFVFSLRVSDSLLPNSRKAVALLGGHADNYSSLSQIPETLISQMWSFLWWSSDATNFLGLLPVVSPQGRGMLVSGMLLVLLFLGVCLGLFLFRADRRARLASLAVLYVAMHIGYYTLFHRIELRYILPPLTLFLVPLGVVVQLSLERFPSRWAAGIAAGALGITFLISLATGIVAYSLGHASVRVHNYHYVALDMARWLAANHPGEKVGAWNAGVLGYYSDTVLFNLDGVINDDALKANQAQQIDKYILDSGIRFIVDEPSQIEDNLARFGRPGAAADILGPVVHRATDGEGRQIIVREVLRPQG